MIDVAAFARDGADRRLAHTAWSQRSDRVRDCKPIRNASTFMLGESVHPIEYESLSTMLATILECYEKEAFFVDHRGYLEMSDDAHAQIARAHNSRVPLWQTSP